MQYLLASLNWREVAREARRREFPTASAVYNQFYNSEGIYLIIPRSLKLYKKFLHPRCICENYICGVSYHGARDEEFVEFFKATARRVVAPYMVWKYLTCDDVVD